jgi:murein L,D-transpeptidase YafK
LTEQTPLAHDKASAVELDHAAPFQIDGVDGYVDGYEGGAGLVSEPFDWAVHAYKSRHLLEVYFKGHLYRTYHAVFGRSPAAGAKLWEGDRRTPEGNYLIVGKHRSSRFGWFLHLNYPNEQDHERFEESRAAHLIPASAHEGGQIGIHGTDAPSLNVADIDWTTGCISVDNTDIWELVRLLPVGTLVIINP